MNRYLYYISLLLLIIANFLVGGNMWTLVILFVGMYLEVCDCQNIIREWLNMEESDEN